MDKTLKELQFIMKKRKELINDDFKVLSLGFTAKKNLCIDEEVRQLSNYFCPLISH